MEATLHRPARVMFTCLQQSWVVEGAARLVEQAKDGALQQAMPEANTVTRELTKQLLRQRGLWTLAVYATCWKMGSLGST